MVAREKVVRKTKSCPKDAEKRVAWLSHWFKYIVLKIMSNIVSDAETAVLDKPTGPVDQSLKKTIRNLMVS